MFQQNDKTNAFETTYILRGFASHIRHLNHSDWRKTFPMNRENRKTWWAETRHETKRHSAYASFLLYCDIQAAVARISVGEGWRRIDPTKQIATDDSLQVRIVFNLEILILQVVVVGRFHSFTPSLPVRHLESGGGGSSQYCSLWSFSARLRLQQSHTKLQ